MLRALTEGEGMKMKDFSREQLEESRPNLSARHCIDFCLDQLFNDDKKRTTDAVVRHLTFEELIGALLLARDYIQEREEDFDPLTSKEWKYLFPQDGREASR
jgi:hypothetical protein